jgi:hypothetical protein
MTLFRANTQKLLAIANRNGSYTGEMVPSHDSEHQSSRVRREVVHHNDPSADITIPRTPARPTSSYPNQDFIDSGVGFSADSRPPNAASKSALFGVGRISEFGLSLDKSPIIRVALRRSKARDLQSRDAEPLRELHFGGNGAGESGVATTPSRVEGVPRKRRLSSSSENARVLRRRSESPHAL